MQGRLSPPINNKIQAFPNNHWKNEFEIAKEIGIEVIEWIVDDIKNPIFSDNKIDEILKLSKKYDVKVNSLCADIFMEKHLFNNSKYAINQNLGILEKLIEQCQKCGIKILELPFVDSSSLKNLEQQNEVIKSFESIISIAENSNITLSLETDLESKTFLEFLEKFNSNSIRANYDVGNSISKNFDPVIELDDLKNWIVNVHIKDRLKHGHTVPLGSGDVKFQEFFEKLKCIDYRGDLILQGAREDLERKIPVRTTCSKYLEFINRYLEKRN